MNSEIGRYLWVIAALSLVLGCGGTSTQTSTQTTDAASSIKIAGSDTMVNLAQAWAEAYSEKYPAVQLEVSGGGSGVGLAGLQDGTVQMANASRDIKPSEREKIKEKFNTDVGHLVVALDALAVYVHPNNPLTQISMSDLKEIYGNGGSITKWEEVAGWPADAPADSGGEIVRVSRQNNSGTYAYFREAVIGKEGEFKLGSLDQSGSKDVVELVSKTPTAIGYSGMGYATEHVKMLPVSSDGGEAVPPTSENAANKSYPLARGLNIYTIGQPEGASKHYLDWCMSDEGQAIVADIGYVPVGGGPAPEGDPLAQ